jgi:hypothetical protein
MAKYTKLPDGKYKVINADPSLEKTHNFPKTEVKPFKQPVEVEPQVTETKSVELKTTLTTKESVSTASVVDDLIGKSQPQLATLDKGDKK